MINEFIIPVAAMLNRVFVPIFTDVLVFALGLFAKTFKTMTDTLNNLTSSVIIPAIEKIKNAFMDMVPRVGSALQDLLDRTIKPFITFILNDFVIPIAGAITDTLVPIFTDVLVFAFEETATAFEWLANLMNDIYKTVIKPVFELIKKIVTDTLKIVMDLWDKHGKTLLKNLSELLKNIQDLFQQFWDKILKPIIEPFLKMLTELWDKHLKGLIKETGEFVMKLVNAALDILNKFIKPIVSYLVDKLSPTFVTVFNLIASVVGSVVGTISDLIKGLMMVLGGSARNVFELLDKDYIPKAAVNLYDLAVDLMVKAKLTKYEIDETLKDIPTEGFKEKQTFRKALQCIGLASKSAVYQNRSGVITVKPFEILDQDTSYIYFAGPDMITGMVSPTVYSGYDMLNITFDNVFKEPQIKLDKLLQSITMTIHTGGTKEEHIFYNAENSEGVNFKCDNPLINTIERAQEVAQWVIDESNLRALYQVNWRQNPALECGDIVLIEDSFGAEKQSRITKQEYNFSGYLSGRTDTKGGV